MDDEYRAFLESAWKSTCKSRKSKNKDVKKHESIEANDGGFKGTEVARSTGIVVDGTRSVQVGSAKLAEVIEIEADPNEEDEDGVCEDRGVQRPDAAVNDKVEAGSEDVAKDATVAAGPDCVIRSRLGGAAATKAFSGRPGLVGNAGKVVTEQTKTLGAIVKAKTGQPPGTLAGENHAQNVLSGPSSTLASSSAPCGTAKPAVKTLDLKSLVGSWSDSIKNHIQVDWASPTTCGSMNRGNQLIVQLIRPGSNQNSVQLKVTQHDAGNFTCGHFDLDVGRSHDSRIVWVDRRSRGKVSVWERDAKDVLNETDAATATNHAQENETGKLDAGNETVTANESKSMNSVESLVVDGPEVPQDTEVPPEIRPTPTQAEQVKSLGARAKVKPERPSWASAQSSHAVTIDVDAEAPDEEDIKPGTEIELATFLGGWVDSMGNSVQVDWARPTCGNEMQGQSLDVQLVRPGSGRQPIRLKVIQLEDGSFKCGHFELDVGQSSSIKIVWGDKWNRSKLSIWKRETKKVGPALSSLVATGNMQKRPWAANNGSSPAAKLPRLSSENGTGPNGASPVGQGPVRATTNHAAVGMGVSAAALQQPRPPPPAMMNIPTNAKDLEGRPYDLHSVVVNFVDVGMSYVKSVLAKNPKHKGDDFDWEGVRRCVRYLRAEREMEIFGIIPEDFQGQDGGSGHRCGLPIDIQLMCEMVEEALPSPYSGEAGAAREMTIERAYTKNCLYVDGGVNSSGLLTCHAKCRAWLTRCMELLQLRYYFDSKLATFDVFDGNVGTGTLVRMNSFS